MSMTRWEPFREMASLRDAFDRFFEEAPLRRGEWLTATRAVPPVDMYEVNGNIELDVALPGVALDEVEVNIVGTTLTVKGEHKKDETIREEDYYRHEVFSGAFTRTVELPTYVNTDKVEARLEDGLLKIVVPKMAEAQPRRIEVKM